MPSATHDMSLPQSGSPHDAARHRSPATTPDLAACRRGGCRVSRRPPPPQPCRATPPLPATKSGPRVHRDARLPRARCWWRISRRGSVLSCTLFNTLADDFEAAADVALRATRFDRVRGLDVGWQASPRSHRVGVHGAHKTPSPRHRQSATCRPAAATRCTGHDHDPRPRWRPHLTEARLEDAARVRS